jgi:hypothetical protein
VTWERFQDTESAICVGDSAEPGKVVQLQASGMEWQDSITVHLDGEQAFRLVLHMTRLAVAHLTRGG